MGVFGTDGVRGRWGEPPLEPRLARALGRALRERAGGPVAIVRDTRESGPEILKAVLEGVGDVALDGGVLPTAGLSAILEADLATYGVAITASHNPWHDNGLKVMGPGGVKLDDGVQSCLEQEIEAHMDCVPYPVSAGELDGEQVWMDAVLAALPAGWNLQDVTIVLDAAHGAAWRVGPKLLQRLGARVLEMGTEPDGRNINQGVGALHPEALGARVREESAQVGIGLDGDADRCVLVDSTGTVVDGDGLMLLLAEPPGLVGTVMCNAALEAALAAKDIALVRTGVGDRQVAARMQDLNWPVGGEPSGHVLFADGLPTGDGLLTGLRALVGGLDLSARLSDWCPSPQSLRAVRVREKPEWTAIDGLMGLVEQAENSSAQRVFIRWSGTEPVLRILVEAVAREDAETWADRMVECVRSAGLTDD
ncbi:MAG: phosphoglucosamine mutase [Myxococcota bacterium]|nr:phosphoglucosamine mutase [Myxococcota bacterium]